MNILMQMGKVLHKWVRVGRYTVFRPELSSILISVDPKAPLGDRISWLESLVNWIRIPLTPSKQKAESGKIEELRLRFLFQWLERNPDYRPKISAVLSSILLDTEPTPLFCQTGLNHEGNFFGELMGRLGRKFLPKPPDDRDFAEVFVRVFSENLDASWIESLNEELLEKIFLLIAPNEQVVDALNLHFRVSMADALLVVGAQVSTFGLNDQIRCRGDTRLILQSPFLKMGVKMVDLHRELLADVSWERRSLLLRDEMHSLCAACRLEIQSVFSHLDEFGVSVGIVYKLELLEQLISRIEAISGILLYADRSTLPVAWRTLLAALARSKVQSTYIRPFLEENLHLISRKISERSGQSGEHYITRSRSEYFQMVASAAGGGLITVITAYVKTVISIVQPAVFFEGLFHSLNYSVSFLTMQSLNFTLATKQPSMTAPALASRLKSIASREQLEVLVTDISAITRSHFAAAIGNVGMVIPGVLVFDFLYYYFTESHVLELSYAVKTVESMNPFSSFTLLFAALTGVLLWASSIAAGWFENWVIFQRIPESIAQSRALHRFIGRTKTERLSQWFTRSAAVIAGNISIGVLLAAPAVLGRLFGVQSLDVRHVTLSAGFLTFSFCSLWGTDLFLWGDVIMAIFAVFCIGMLNFGVSFFLALYVAIRARNVRKVWLRFLRHALARRFYKKPKEFFIPN